MDREDIKELIKDLINDGMKLEEAIQSFKDGHDEWEDVDFNSIKFELEMEVSNEQAKVNVEAATAAYNGKDFNDRIRNAHQKENEATGDIGQYTGRDDGGYGRDDDL